MKTISMLLISLIIANSSYAQEAVEIQKGQPAPYTGVLLTPSKAESVKRELLEKDKLQEINESFKRSIVLHKENDQYYQQQMQGLREENKELNKKANLSTLEKMGWVALGVLATGLAFKGLQTVSR